MASETPSKPPPLPVIGLANRWLRIVAALLDFAIITLVTGFALSRFLWPENFPEVYNTLLEWNDQNAQRFEQWAEEGGDLPAYQAPGIAEEKLMEFRAYSLAVFATFVWAYFFVSESLMRGGSLGKATFGIRVISLRTGMAPSALEAAFRAVAKAFFFLDPVLFLPIDLAVMAFNGQRRSAHDLLARTIVVSGKSVIIQPDAKAGNE